MIASITRRSTFAALASDGERVRHGAVRLRWLSAEHPDMQPGTSLALAFAFSRRFGTAVERNRAKRRLRSAIRDADIGNCQGALLMSGTRQVLDRPYPQLVDDVRHCLGPASRSHPHRELDSGNPGSATS